MEQLIYDELEWRCNQASEMCQKGSLNEANECYSDLIPVLEEKYGPNDPETLSAKLNYTFTLKGFQQE